MTGSPDEASGARRLRFIRALWSVVGGYWKEQDRVLAISLLGVVVGLDVFLVWIAIRINGANGVLYNALQLRLPKAFYRSLAELIFLILLQLMLATSHNFLNQILQLRWREWLVDSHLHRWLANSCFYRMRFADGMDNPDQRISEDIRLFAGQTLTLGLGLLSSLLTLVSFTGILWNLSGAWNLQVGRFSLVIPAYLFWVAVVYAASATLMSQWIGKPLIGLNNIQQRVEADFRFALVRVREEAEGIALYHGEEEERRNAQRCFAAVRDNFRRLIAANIRYYSFQSVVGQIPTFVPLLIAGPRYFAGTLQLGPLMQSANAFGRVSYGLSWLIDNYAAFAEWYATAERLTAFAAAMDRQETRGCGGLTVRHSAERGAILLEGVRIHLPGGSHLLSPTTVRLSARERVLLRGQSGIGKSTLFRTVAGIWPFATGVITVPRDEKILFLPQRPYMPIGTLRNALWFPQAASGNDDRARFVLAQVGLEFLASRLDETSHWQQILSPGEQQRLTIARALLTAPDWLFLDEATSAVGEEMEQMLYDVLQRQLPHTAIVTIGHRRSLESHHERVFVLE